MLPESIPAPTRKLRLLTGAALAVALFLAANPTGRAADVKGGSALSFLPDDAAFVGSLLRNKEQVNLFLNSKAYKTLRELPIVKEQWAKAQKDLAKADGPLGMYNEFVKDPENKELVDLLLEAVSDETFIYGGRLWNDFTRLASAINNAQSWAPLTAMMAGRDPQREQVRAMLVAAQKNAQLIKIPETVVGMKVKSAAKVGNQLKRLEKLAEMAFEQAPPLKGKMKRQKIGGGDFLTIELDGSIVPWDDVNLKDYEDKKDEFEELIKAAKKLTLCVSLGVKDGYLLFGITGSAKDIERLGAKGVKKLESRDEMKTLDKYADKPVTGLKYVSREYVQTNQRLYTDMEQVGETLRTALEKAEGLKEERKKAILKDIDKLITEAKKQKPEGGAQVGFSYLTPTGYEGFEYDFGNHEGLKGVNARLMSHLGGRPIFAAAFGARATGEGYKDFVDFLKMAYGHGEGAFLDSPMLPDEAKEIFKKITGAVLPSWRKIDDITTKMLIPSLKETGLGLVLDAKWTSDKWHNEMPKLDKPLPMLELGLLVGLSDGKLFEKAMTAYRQAFNEMYDKGRTATPMGADLPPFAIPDPQTETVKVGKLFFYPLPEEAGLDKQVQPVAGVADKVAVIALSKKHAERLMTATPLAYKSGPLSRKGSIVGLSLLDWPQLVDVAVPWVEFSVRAVNKESTAKKDKDEVDSILKQVRTVAGVLKCFRGASSASYLDEGRLVTHSEVVVKDLD